MALKERLKMWLEPGPQNERRHAGRLQNARRIGSIRSIRRRTMRCGLSGTWPATDNFVLSKIAPEKAIELPASNKNLFGMGSKPVSDPAIYPTPEEALRVVPRSPASAVGACSIR